METDHTLVYARADDPLHLPFPRTQKSRGNFSTGAAQMKCNTVKIRYEKHLAERLRAQRLSPLNLSGNNCCLE